LSGTIIPDTSDILTEVQAEWQSTLGEQLALASNTPQGIAIASDTISRETTALNNAAVANQLNPNLAGGIALDAIGALMGIPRPAGVFSIIPLVTLNGVAGTVVPSGTTGQDDNGNIFASDTTVTLASNGGAQVNFQALEPGPITVAPGGFTSIVSGPLGLETITNASATSPVGSFTFTDNQYRTLRNIALAQQGSGLAQACMAAIALVPNVTSQSFQENVTNDTLTINGVSMAPHSLYSCVAGGVDADVANALSNKKGGGCNYNNGPGINISVPVTNPYSGQTINVLFDRPNLIPVLVAVTVVMNVATPNPTQVVNQAVLDYANGLIFNQVGFGVGVTVSSFALAAAINDEVPGLFVKTIYIAKASAPPPTSSDPIAINVYEMATIQDSSITVTVVAS